eukprot:454861-Amphidinium_carterae.1
MAFHTVVLTPDGSLRRTELRGHANYAEWQEACRLLKTALIFFDAVTPAQLQRHENHILLLSQRFGSDHWGTIYTAD